MIHYHGTPCGGRSEPTDQEARMQHTIKKSEALEVRDASGRVVYTAYDLSQRVELKSQCAAGFTVRVVKVSRRKDLTNPRESG